MFYVHGTQVSHITGRSRPPGGVELTPRQYTEWNVVGRARSTGDPSQQGLLPEVYRTASTGRHAHLHYRMLNKPTNYQQPKDPRSCARVVYKAGDTLRHQPMGAGHMTVLQLCGPMVFHVLQWCHPRLASWHNEGKLLYPDHHLIWCTKVDSGPHTAVLFSQST